MSGHSKNCSRYQPKQQPPHIAFHERGDRRHQHHAPAQYGEAKIIFHFDCPQAKPKMKTATSKTSNEPKIM